MHGYHAMDYPAIPNLALVENTSQRLPCVLVLDGSASMNGEPIRELNRGLRALEAALKEDPLARQRVQLLVVRFGDADQVSVLTDWTDAMTFSAPTVAAHGSTPMGHAMALALKKVSEQKEQYRINGIPYNRPWIFLITDGEPTDNDWEPVAASCREAEAAGKHTLFAIGVGDKANLHVLQQFGSRKPVALKGLNFHELFEWLSQSVQTASKAAQGSGTALTPIDSWGYVPG